MRGRVALITVRIECAQEMEEAPHHVARGFSEGGRAWLEAVWTFVSVQQGPTLLAWQQSSFPSGPATTRCTTRRPLPSSTRVRCPVPDGCRIVVDVEDPAAPARFSGGALYARVSTRKQAAHLDAQLARLRGFAAAQGVPVVAEVSEIASGVSDRRPKLRQLLGRGLLSTLSTSSTPTGWRDSGAAGLNCCWRPRGGRSST